MVGHGGLRVELGEPPAGSDVSGPNTSCPDAGWRRATGGVRAWGCPAGITGRNPAQPPLETLQSTSFPHCRGCLTRTRGAPHAVSVPAERSIALMTPV